MQKISGKKSIENKTFAKYWSKLFLMKQKTEYTLLEKEHRKHNSNIVAATLSISRKFLGEE